MWTCLASEMQIDSAPAGASQHQTRRGGAGLFQPWKAEMLKALKSHLSPLQYYAHARSLGGMNGGNAGTTGLESRTERYSAPRQSQTSMTIPGRIATRQCRSSVKCVAEDEEVWRCPWWAVCTSSIPSVCTRHATAAMASRHATRAGRNLCRFWRQTQPTWTLHSQCHSPPPSPDIRLLGC